MNMRILTILIISCNICFGQNVDAGQSEWKRKDWQSEVSNQNPLKNLLSQLDKSEHKLHSMLIIKYDFLVLEKYYNNHMPTEQHDLRSATKSIISILMGIAIDKGFVADVNEPIAKYLSPTYKVPVDKESITIHHLLTMSTGMDCNDWDQTSKGQEDKVYKKKNWVQYTLNLPMINPPGELAQYCTMGTVLTAEIIQEASGMDIASFADQYLFIPMKINALWDHTSNKKNIPGTGKRLYLTSLDFAKIARLVLNKGQWNGQQLVSESWLKLSTQPITKITGVKYGYYWWTIPFKTPNSMIEGIVATGNGGQYLMIFPTLDLALVFTGGAYNSQEDKLPFQIANKVILPAFME